MSENLTTELATIPSLQERANEIKELLGQDIEKLREVPAKIEDDETSDRITTLSANLKTKLDLIKGIRRRWYEPLREKLEDLRLTYDNPMKTGKAVIDHAMSKVAEYNTIKRREAEVAREKAEAEARRQREEADRKKREAEEAAARAKAESERRKREEDQAKQREEERKRREIEEKARAEAEAKRKQEEELARQQKEEEDARLRHAEEAERVGNTDKIDTTLDKPKPIATQYPEVPKGPTQEEIEAKQKEAEAEQKRKDEEQARIEESKKREIEEKERAEKAKREAEEADAKAKQAEIESATAPAVALRKDDRTQDATNWVYRIKDREQFKRVVKAVAQSCDADPSILEYLGFNPEKPDSFRTKAITRDVTRLKSAFRFPGIDAMPALKTRVKSNTIKAEEDQ